jgi:hypothetical protein
MAFVDNVLPFAKTADVLAYVETGQAKGKVVVTFNRPGRDHAS